VHLCQLPEDVGDLNKKIIASVFWLAWFLRRRLQGAFSPTKQAVTVTVLRSPQQKV
jgi:hypothetical protein